MPGVSNIVARLDTTQVSGGTILPPYDHVHTQNSSLLIPTRTKHTPPKKISNTTSARHPRKLEYRVCVRSPVRVVQMIIYFIVISLLFIPYLEQPRPVISSCFDGTVLYRFDQSAPDGAVSLGFPPSSSPPLRMRGVVSQLWAPRSQSTFPRRQL